MEYTISRCSSVRGNYGPNWHRYSQGHSAVSPGGDRTRLYGHAPSLTRRQYSKQACDWMRRRGARSSHITRKMTLSFQGIMSACCAVLTKKKTGRNIFIVSIVAAQYRHRRFHLNKLCYINLRFTYLPTYLWKFCRQSFLCSVHHFAIICYTIIQPSLRFS